MIHWTLSMYDLGLPKLEITLCKTSLPHHATPNTCNHCSAFDTRDTVLYTIYYSMLLLSASEFSQAGVCAAHAYMKGRCC